MDKYYKVIKSKNKHRKYLIYQHQDFRTCFENSKGLTEEYQDSINEHPEKVYAFDFDGTIAECYQERIFIFYQAGMVMLFTTL